MGTVMLTITKVLLVEDNPSDAFIIRRSLMAQPGLGFDIVTADSLAMALASLDGQEIDLILLDLSLPDSSGLATLSLIQEAAPETPTVVLTANDDEGIGLACIDAGAQDYMSKALMTPRSLYSVVSFALRRYRESQAKLMRMVVQSDHTLSTSSAAVPVTRDLAGLPPIRTRQPSAFTKIKDDYKILLQLYMEHIIKKIDKPKANIEVIATKLGDLGATPRDLIDIHTEVLSEICANNERVNTYTFAADSRLFALEMMGMLVEYYRTGFRRLVAGGAK